MKRKYYYGARILYNLIRVPFRRLVYFRRLEMDLIQNMSPRVGIRVFGNGHIKIHGRITAEDGVLIEANNGTVDITSCFINRNTTIVSMNNITIKKGVTIGPGVAIYDHDHNISFTHNKEEAYICAPVIVERNAWIGANAVILKGVTVGECAVVASGAVVNKNVAPHSIVGGVPAKVIGNRMK